jgi:hypothetical protein
MGSGRSVASAAVLLLGRPSSGLGASKFVVSMFVPESRRFAPRCKGPRHVCAKAMSELRLPREWRRGR